MAESTKNKATISQQNQLHWFVNKLISIYKNPITVILQEYNELTCFPVGLLKKEETGLFPLGRNASATEYDSEDQEYASYCIEMLEKIKGDISKLEVYGLHFNKEDFSWYEDNNNYEGNGYAFYLDCDYRQIFEAYLHYMNDSKKDKKKGGIIKKIEILKNKNETGRIKVYINGNYDNDPLDFARGKNWQLMYKIANKEYIAYDNKSKEFYDYFNHIKNNPLYKTYGFEVTQILKEEDGYIVPNIEIKLTTPNKTTRQLKSA